MKIASKYLANTRHRTSVRPDSIGEMARPNTNAGVSRQKLDSVELDPNGWEQGFLQSIKEQLDKKNSLTDPQENKLLSILQRSRKWRDDRGG